MSGITEIGRINSTQFRNLGMEKRMKATKVLSEQKVAEQFESRAFRTLSRSHLSGEERVKYMEVQIAQNRKEGSKHSQKYRAPGRKSKSPATSNKNISPKDNNKLIGKRFAQWKRSSGAWIGG